MMTNIYDLHVKAFANVSAYIVLNETGERVATIAFKFPKDGAGRLYVYLHWLGLEMVRGFAGGYGYDKRSAACSNAAKALLDTYQAPREVHERATALQSGFMRFHAALAQDSGKTWETQLRDAGFIVLQAV